MQHKWHKEIKAWADGAEIETRQYIGNGKWDEWESIEESCYSNFLTDNGVEYRIKPQPKEPQYLYVYFDPNYGIETKFIANKNAEPPRGMEYLGKIKLEVDDVPSDV